MVRLSRALVAGAFFASFMAPAWAQSLTLAEAQRLAVARSEQLVANEAAAAANREMAVAAGQLPDPVLRVGVENLPVTGHYRFSFSRDFMTMRRIGLMQEFTRGDKRRLRTERAELESARVEAEGQMVLAEIQRETALAWIDSAYTAQAAGLLKSQLSESRLQTEAAELAFRAGRGGQGDVFAARAAIAMLEDRLRQAERQARTARIQLARWVGPEAALRPLAGSADWRHSVVDESVVAGHLKRHPHIQLQLARVGAAESEVKLAQANTRSDWTVEVTYAKRGPAFSDMVSVGLSMPLQLDRPKRQNRELAAKVAMLAEAEAVLEETVRAEEAKVRVLLDEWRTGKQRLDALTAQLLPAARNRTDAESAAYRAGRAELAAVLSARRDEIDARSQLLALEMEVARLWAQLNFLVAE